MSWVLIVGAGWLGVGAVLAVIVGRSIRLADAKARRQKAAAAMAARDEPNIAVEQPLITPGPATVPSFDALVVDIRQHREVSPARPPVLGDDAPPAERRPATRASGPAGPAPSHPPG